MVSSTRSFRMKHTKRSTIALADDSISGPKLLSSNASSRNDLQLIRDGGGAAFQDNQWRNAKSTTFTRRRRPRLENAKSSAGQVKIFYIPPTQDAAIGVALGSPSQEMSFEPSRPAPVPVRLVATDDAMRPPLRSESVPNIRPRLSRWRSFGSILFKSSTSHASHRGENEDIPLATDIAPASVPPPRFPMVETLPSSTHTAVDQISEEELMALGPMPRPFLGRGTSSSIAAPQQVQVSNEEHVDQILPGLPGSVQAATQDLIAMSRRIDEEKNTEEKNSDQSSSRKDSVILVPINENGSSPLPLEDDGYFGRKLRKSGQVESLTDIKSMDTMKEVVLQEPDEAREVELVESPREIEHAQSEVGMDDGRNQREAEDSESMLMIEAMADENAQIESNDLRDISKGPWLDVVIPRIEMERYSIMFGSVLKWDRDQGFPQGLPQGLLERRQVHVEKLRAVPKAIPESKELDATGDIIPRSAGVPQEASPNLKESDTIGDIIPRPADVRQDASPQPKELGARDNVLPESTGIPQFASPKPNEPDAIDDIIPQSAGASLYTPSSLYPEPLRLMKSAKSPSPRPLLRSHTSPRLSSPVTGTFFGTPPSTGASSATPPPPPPPRSWSDDNILLVPTPATWRRLADDEDSVTVILPEDGPETVPLPPPEPQWEMMNTAPMPTKPPRPRIGLPASVRPVKSGVYVAQRAEITNGLAREVSFSGKPKQLVLPIVSKPL